MLLVDEDAPDRLGYALANGELKTLPDQRLGARHASVVADHLLERPAMVEGEDVETLGVPELVQSDAHRNSLPVNCVSLLKLCLASIRRTVPERERITSESVIAPSRT